MIAAAPRRLPRQRQDIESTSSATSSTTRCARRCSTPATASTAASRTKSARSRSTPACCRARTARRSSRAARRRRSSPSTLGTANDVQRLDSIDEAGETTKSFMLHYNFPPFSTGEVRPMRGTQPPRDRPRQPGRARAAERAADVRGVPVHDPHRVRRPRVERLVVDGVGLRRLARAVRCRRADSRRRRRRRDGTHQGRQASTRSSPTSSAPRITSATWTSRSPAPRTGITSIQMDIKIEGLDLTIMKEALAQAKEGRLHILGEMDKALAAPRAELSPYAPRIVTMKISPEKIGDLIGPKGKTIRGIQDETGAELTVDDTGLVTIAAVGGEVDGARAADGPGAHGRADGRRDVRGHGEEHDAVRRVRRDHAGHRRPAAHLRDAARAHREDGGRRQEGRPREGQAHRPRRARTPAAVDEGAAAEARKACPSPSRGPATAAPVVASAATVAIAATARAAGRGAESARGGSEHLVGERLRLARRGEPGSIARYSRTA